MREPRFSSLDAGTTVVVASPEGGMPPLDPNSNPQEPDNAARSRISSDAVAEPGPAPISGSFAVRLCLLLAVMLLITVLLVVQFILLDA